MAYQFRYTLSDIIRESKVIGSNAYVQLPTVGRTVSTEALKVNFVHKKLAEQLKKLWGTTTEYISTLFDSAPKQLRGSVTLGDTIRAAQNNPYLNDVELKMPVPEGLQSSYLEYVELLIGMADAVDEFYDSGLIPFKTWVGSVLNNPEKISTIAPGNHLKTFDPTQFIDLHAKSFKGHAVEVKYRQVIKRNSDWELLETKLNELLSKMSGEHSPQAVSETVRNLDTMLGELIDGLVDPDKTYIAAPRNIDALARHVANLAKMLEFYGMVCASAEALAVAVEEAGRKYVSKH